MVTNSIESQYTSICERLQDLSVLRPLQEEVASVHEAIKYLRDEIGKLDIPRKDAASYNVLNYGSRKSSPMKSTCSMSSAMPWLSEDAPVCWSVHNDLAEEVVRLPHRSPMADISLVASGNTSLRDVAETTAECLPDPEKCLRQEGGTFESVKTSVTNVDESLQTSSTQIEETSDKLRNTLLLPKDCHRDHGSDLRRTRTGDINSFLQCESTFATGVPPRRRRCRLHQLHPDSFVRSIWDLASCLALMFDSIMIPYILAWDPDSRGFILFAMFFTAVFWTIDIFATLNTSFFTSDGDLETHPLSIFKRYLKRTLLLDAFICTTDWLSIVADYGARSGSSESNETWSLLRLVKINRIFRLASVLRVSRLWDRLEQLNRARLSNTWQLLAQIAAIFVLILWVNHILCCVWYAIGVHGSRDTGQSWLDAEVNSENDMPIHQSSDLYKYTTAFHWSISQLTPGSMQVMPMNSLERIVNIASLLFGLLFVTSLISRMSALMVQLQMANRDKNEIIRMLRLFLRQKSVTASVAQRIERQVVSQLKSVRPLTMNDIPALSSLSKTLRVELKCDIYSQHLLRQRVLRCLLTSTYFGVRELATGSRQLRAFCDTIECMQLTTSTELFTKGEVTRKSYLLIHGCLLYDDNEFHAAAAEKGMTEPRKVTATSSWICPAALWLEWRTKGYMEADSSCEVACLDGSKVLLALAGLHKRLDSLVRHYQRTFARLMSTDVPLDNLTDLEEAVDHALVVLHLPVGNKLELCQALFENLRQRTWLWGSAQEQAFKDLEVEVAKGKSALIQAEDGSPIRVAIVCALRITRPRGEMLVQVVDIKGSKLNCVCRLPGTKMEGDEVPSASARRLLDEVRDNLQDDSGAISAPMPHSTDTEKSTSPTYGVLTQYKRTIFVAYLDTSKPSPPRIQFEYCSTSRRFSHFGIMRSASDTTINIDETFVREYLATHLPWLEGHCHEHIHLALKPDGKGAVYAWMFPDEFATMQTLLKERTTRTSV